MPGSNLEKLSARLAIAVVALVTLALPGAPLNAEEARPHPREFANGLPKDVGFFPIGVWMQKPATARAYSAIGINTFVGQWSAPNDTQLEQFERHGIHVILEQTPQTLALRNKHVIRGWLQGDEPDNAQPNGTGGYGDCISPENVVRRYKEIAALDPTRPVYLNFGQAVANPKWFGRGAKCGAIAPEDYYKPASFGGDIVAFDIYPATEFRQPHVTGRLDLVGRGVANLKRWSAPGQPVWVAIETAHIYNPTRRPTPSEVRSEIWMALIHGANGVVYFVHEWKPSFREDGVFRYSDTVDEISRINAQIRRLAPVLNSVTASAGAQVDAPVEIATMIRRHGSAVYLFAANMENKPARVRIKLPYLVAGDARVLDEERTLKLNDGALVDDFGGYDVHIYQIPQT